MNAIDRRSTATRSARRVEALGPWFHNIDLDGVQTAPDHFLGDYPAVKWRSFADAIPSDLTGKTVLDIGCNGGFYSIEMKRRGAERVLGIDFDDGLPGAGPLRRRGQRARHRVPQALGLRRRRARRAVRRRAVHGRALPPAPPAAGARPDPRACRRSDLLVFQSMQRGSEGGRAGRGRTTPSGRPSIFDRPGYPKLHFVEQRYADDPTNWWMPNRACVEAMLRSAGFAIVAPSRGRGLHLPARRSAPDWRRRGLSGDEGAAA